MSEGESGRERSRTVGRTLGCFEASKLLERGELVYRRYPNGRVYAYCDHKYAPVNSEGGFGDFKAFSAIRDIGMDIGEWFVQ